MRCYCDGARGEPGAAAASTSAAASSSAARIASVRSATQRHARGRWVVQQQAYPPRLVDPTRLVAFSACHHVVPLPDGHRFPMEKYARTVSNLAGDASLADKLDVREGPLADVRDLALVHDEEYIQRFVGNRMTEPEMRNVGFPWSEPLVARTLSSAGGTLAATRLVLDGHVQFAANVAGGTHHAFRASGEGYCVFNDVALSAAVAIHDYGLDSVLVLDLDVHQGNGTAGIFAGEPRVTTFDMYGDKNYPWKTRMSNTYDVPLSDGTRDEEYLGLLADWLPLLISRHRPQLLVFQAGVDPLHGDSFGRLSLTRDGLMRRNHMVYSAALEHGLPLVITMGGGYTKPMDRSIEAHTDVYRTAAYRLHAWARFSGPGAQEQQSGKQQTQAATTL